MITAATRLKKLRNKLPVQIGPEGFGGNISGTPKFITDGITLLLSSALLEDIEVELNERATLKGEKEIQTLWHMKTRVASRLAYFIGCGAWSNGTTVAVLHDTKNYIYVDPYRLSWALQAVAADSMEVSKYMPAESPILLYRQQNPVGLIAPMRLAEGAEGLEARYDFDAAIPVPIQFALSRE